MPIPAKTKNGEPLDVTRLSPNEVLLNIYDVGESKTIGRINAASSALGGGVYHGAVELFGQEWSFGFTEEGSGICRCVPRGASCHSYRCTVPMGRTKLSEAEVAKVLRKMEVEWRGTDYHLLKRNCLDFSSAFCTALGCGRIPSWVDRYGRTAEKIGDVVATPLGGLKRARGIWNGGKDKGSEKPPASRLCGMGCGIDKSILAEYMSDSDNDDGWMIKSQVSPWTPQISPLDGPDTRIHGESADIDALHPKGTVSASNGTSCSRGGAATLASQGAKAPAPEGKAPVSSGSPRTRRRAATPQANPNAAPKAQPRRPKSAGPRKCKDSPAAADVPRREAAAKDAAAPKAAAKEPAAKEAAAPKAAAPKAAAPKAAGPKAAAKEAAAKEAAAPKVAAPKATAPKLSAAKAKSSPVPKAFADGPPVATADAARPRGSRQNSTAQVRSPSVKPPPEKFASDGKSSVKPLPSKARPNLKADKPPKVGAAHDDHCTPVNQTSCTHATLADDAGPGPPGNTAPTGLGSRATSKGARRRTHEVVGSHDEKPCKEPGPPAVGNIASDAHPSRARKPSRTKRKTAAPKAAPLGEDVSETDSASRLAPLGAEERAFGVNQGAAPSSSDSTEAECRTRSGGFNEASSSSPSRDTDSTSEERELGVHQGAAPSSSSSTGDECRSGSDGFNEPSNLLPGRDNGSIGTAPARRESEPRPGGLPTGDHVQQEGFGASGPLCPCNQRKTGAAVKPRRRTESL